MLLLTGIGRERCLLESRYDEKGERVQANHYSRQVLEIYNIGIARLTQPKT